MAALRETEPRFMKNAYYRCTRNGRVYRCSRVDSDGYVVLSRLSREGLIEIDPAPEFWKFYERCEPVLPRKLEDAL